MILRICQRNVLDLFLQVKLVRCCPEDEDFKRTFRQELEVYRKYQIEIHKDDPDEVDERQVSSGVYFFLYPEHHYVKMVWL